jgi:hypothetical protein
MTPDYVPWPANFRNGFVEYPNFTIKDAILLLAMSNPVIYPLWF